MVRQDSPPAALERLINHLSVPLHPFFFFSRQLRNASFGGGGRGGSRGGHGGRGGAGGRGGNSGRRYNAPHGQSSPRSHHNGAGGPGAVGGFVKEKTFSLMSATASEKRKAARDAKKVEREGHDAMKDLAVPIGSVKTDRLKVRFLDSKKL